MIIFASLVELAYTKDLKSFGEIHEGSNPLARINYKFYNRNGGYYIMEYEKRAPN